MSGGLLSWATETCSALSGLRGPDIGFGALETIDCWNKGAEREPVSTYSLWQLKDRGETTWPPTSVME